MNEKMTAIMKTKPAYGAELVGLMSHSQGKEKFSSRFLQLASAEPTFISMSGMNGHRAE